MSTERPRSERFLDFVVFAGFAGASLARFGQREDAVSLAIMAAAGFVFAWRGRASRVLAILLFLLAWFVSARAAWLLLALCWVVRSAVRSGAEPAKQDAASSGAAGAATPSIQASVAEPLKPTPDEVEASLRKAHGEDWPIVAVAHDDVDVRRRALRVLIDRGREADHVHIARVAATDRDRDLGLDAVGALARAGSRSAIEALLSVVERGREERVDWKVLELATRKLARCGQSWIVPHLVEALDTKDSLLPGELGGALEHHPAEASAELLGALTRPDPREKARAARTRARVVAKRVLVIELLAKLDHQPAGPALAELLGSAEAAVRAAAAEALGVLRAESARPQLRAALADPDPRVVAAAAGALGMLRDMEAFDALLELGDHISDLVRESAVSALGRLADPRAAPLLGRLFRIPELRANAGEALLAVGGEEAAEVLVPHLADRDATLRIAAVAVLAELRTATADREIASLIKRADVETRAAAADALGRLGHATALPFLERCLTDPAAIVRASAVKGLARMGRFERIDTELIGDVEPRVREAAWDAIGQSGVQPPRDAIASALCDPSPAVRSSAFRVASASPDTENLAALALAEDSASVSPEAIQALASHGSGARILIGALPRLEWSDRRLVADALVIVGPEIVATLLDGLEASPALSRLWRVDALRRIDTPPARAALHRLAAQDPDARIRRRASAGLAASPGSDA